MKINIFRKQGFIKKIFRHELKAILEDRSKILTLTGIIILPLIYAVLYLWAFWDPYGNMSNVPVDVVNLDKGTISQNKNYNFGNDLSRKLKDNDSLKWNFVSLKDAETRLENLSSYGVIVIKKDFSEKVLSADSNSPSKASIEYKSREASNLLISMYSKRVMEAVVTEVNKNITEEYWKKTFEETKSSGEDIKKAANGANDLTNGISEIKNGDIKINQGLNETGTGTAKLYTGLSDLKTGTNKLKDGLNALYVNTLPMHSNIVKAKEATGSILDGALTLKTGTININNNLNLIVQKFSDLENSSKKITDGLNNLSGNYLAVQETIKQLSTQEDSNNEKISVAVNNINSYLTAHPEAADNENLRNVVSALNEVKQETSAMKININTADSGLSQMGSINRQLAEGEGRINQGITVLSEGITLVKTGNDSLVTGFTPLTSGLALLKEGMSQMDTATATLSAGIEQLQKGENDIADGISSAYEGSSNLASAIAKLSEGGESLLDGINEAFNGSYTLTEKLFSGLKKITDKTDTAKTNKQLPVLSAPVSLIDKSIAKVVNYGTGFAPYFIPLALWVGSMVIFFLISAETLNLMHLQTSSFIMNLGKYIVSLSIGILQAVILNTVLLLFLHLKVKYLMLFYIFSILLSACYISIIQLLNNIFGENIARFIAIALLMLQLTSSAGTYPIESAPEFFRAIHGFLPMTYAVNSFREIISGGSLMIIQNSMTTVIIYLIVFLAILLYKDYARHAFISVKNSISKKK